jgi:hypothetical protein
MPDEWYEHDDVVAAGSSCPMPDCGALTVAYRSADDVGHDDAEPWEFTCPRCGLQFTVPEGDLILQSVPEDWLLAKVHAA